MPTILQCVALGALPAAVIACGNEYTYLPTTNANAQVNGRLASDYAIPPEAPRGDVRIASFGFADLAPRGAEGDDGATLRSVHIRFVIANNADRPWSLDVRQQRLELAKHGQSAPAYAAADSGEAPPIVTIPAGGKRTIDLFFPLPADEQQASDIPELDVVWTVSTPERAVTERTPFARVVVEPPPDMYDGYGPYWYDRAYIGFGGVIGGPGPHWSGPVYVHEFHRWPGHPVRRR